jgi:hypothetical protein
MGKTQPDGGNWMWKMEEEQWVGGVISTSCFLPLLLASSSSASAYACLTHQQHNPNLSTFSMFPKFAGDLIFLLLQAFPILRVNCFAGFT